MSISASKVNGFAVVGPSESKLSASKVNAYGVVAPPTDRVAATKVVAYAVIDTQPPPADAGSGSYTITGASSTPVIDAFAADADSYTVTGASSEAVVDAFAAGSSSYTITGASAFAYVGSVDAAHRYWRIYVRAVNGKIDGSTGMREVELREAFGGADVTGSGTATASSQFSSTFAGSKAFDNSASTEWATAIVGLPHWLKYDFGPGGEKAISEVNWIPRTALGQEPISWDLQWSDDDSTWTTKFSVDYYSDQSRDGTSYTVNSDDGPTVNAENKQAWRVNVSANDGGGVTTICELEMRATPGGANLCAGGSSYASTTYDGVTPSWLSTNAFDGSTSTSWSSNVTLGWLAYKFIAPVEVCEIAITARNDSAANQSPKDFTVEYWDGSAWVVAETFTGSSGWTAGETRTFTVSIPPVNADTDPGEYEVVGADTAEVVTDPPPAPEEESSSSRGGGLKLRRGPEPTNPQLERAAERARRRKADEEMVLLSIIEFVLEN